MQRFFIISSLILVNTNTQAQLSASSIEANFKDYIHAENVAVSNGSALQTFMVKENTKGNRYLFENWVSGKVKGNDGTAFNTDSVYFNYDKIEEKLLIRLNNRVLELRSSDISSFEIGNEVAVYQFVHLKDLLDMHFYQPVYGIEKGYSFYKLLNTKFRKADFQTNGIATSGNKYDEYIDEIHYFLLTPKWNCCLLKTLNKSSY